MYCAQCGAQMADGARFCTACGSEVGKPQASTPPVGLSSPLPPMGYSAGPPQAPASPPQAPTGSFWQEGWKLPHGYRTDLQYVTLIVAIVLLAEGFIAVLQGDVVGLLLNYAVALAAAWASLAIRQLQGDTARTISLLSGILCAVFALYDVVNHVNPQAPIAAAFSAGALLYTYAQLQIGTRR